VRQQVMNVVRRAAQQGQGQAPMAPPASAAPQQYAVAAPPQPSVSQRLQELETLRATGTISEAEYTAKRQQILAGL